MSKVLIRLVILQNNGDAERVVLVSRVPMIGERILIDDTSTVSVTAITHQGSSVESRVSSVAATVRAVCMY